MFSTTKSTLITSCRIYDFHDYRTNVFIHFDDKIIQVQSMDHYEEYCAQLAKENPDLTGIEVLNGAHLLVMPGLVAGHTHIYSTFARGLSLPFDPKSFQDILDQLWWKIDGEMNLTDVYYSGLYAGLDYLKSGVTTVIDHHASGRIKGSLEMLEKSLCQEIGLRAGLCFESSDRYELSECIHENINYRNDHRSNEDTFGLFGMHASMSLSDDSLKKIKEAMGDMPIHIHVAESQEDQAHCISTYGMRIVQRLDSFGLLTEGSILAHCIHIDDTEAELIAKRKCYVALNVTSNMNNSVGIPNISLLQKYNIPCVIGNDGMTSDIASEWRNALFVFHHSTQSPTGFNLDDLAKIIQNSYTLLNRHLNIKIGRVEPGFVGDLIAIDYAPPTAMLQNNALGHFIYGLAHQFRPEYVWTKGLMRIDRYRPHKEHMYKVEDTLAECIDVSRDLWKRILEG